MTSVNSNFYLPPEWTRQSGAMLTWPHSQSDWKSILDTVEPVYTEIARQISLKERLLIVCFNEKHKTHIKTLLTQENINLSGVIFFISESDDTWARDHAPLSVYKNKKPVLLDFEFNGWGNKYPYQRDNKITENLCHSGIFSKVHCNKIDMVFEGGSIDVNGAGEMLTTSRCLLSKKRNPEISQDQIEKKMGELFSVNTICWLQHGYLEGDDTDAHIDTLARFCNENTIVYTSCKDKQDIHYTELKLMAEELETWTSNSQKKFRLLPLPIPKAIYNAEGKRLPANYANFFIINRAVLVPLYNDPADVQAIDTLKTCFPDKEIIGIDCLPLIQQFGSLHCITMQFPEGILD